MHSLSKLYVAPEAIETTTISICKSRRYPENTGKIIAQPYI